MPPSWRSGSSLLRLLATATVSLHGMLAAEVRLISELVTFKAWHDPHEIELADGRTYSVRLPIGYFERIEIWKPGTESLVLSYSEESGAVLQSVSEGIPLPICGWDEGEHPIDSVARREFGVWTTTIGMVEVYALSATLWDREIARAYGILINDPRATAESREAWRRAQVAWRYSAEASSKAMVAQCSLQDGTLWRVRAASEDCELRSRHAAQLLGLTATVVRPAE